MHRPTNTIKMGKIKKLKEVLTVVTEDIICDCCGNSCNAGEISGDDHVVSFEYMKMSAEWGFFSNKDLEKWVAFICEKCVDEKFPFIKFVKTDLKFITKIG